MKKVKLLTLAMSLLSVGMGCSHTRNFPGTNIPETEVNQEIIDIIEEYRMKLITKDIDGLLLLASERYFEDGGTPRANDDYGFSGLSTILNQRLKDRVESLRYDIQYKSIKVSSDGRAEVEAFLSGAFELKSDVGDRYRRINDFHRFVLERSTSGGTAKWKFLSGM